MLICGIVMTVLGVLLLIPALIIVVRLIVAFIIDAWHDNLEEFYGLFVFAGVVLLFMGSIMISREMSKQHRVEQKEPIGFSTEQPAQEESDGELQQVQRQQ